MQTSFRVLSWFVPCLEGLKYPAFWLNWISVLRFSFKNLASRRQKNNKGPQRVWPVLPRGANMASPPLWVDPPYWGFTAFPMISPWFLPEDFLQDGAPQLVKKTMEPSFSCEISTINIHKPHRIQPLFGKQRELKKRGPSHPAWQSYPPESPSGYVPRRWGVCRFSALGGWRDGITMAYLLLPWKIRVNPW